MCPSRNFTFVRRLSVAFLVLFAVATSAGAALEKVSTQVTIDNTSGGVPLPATLIKPSGVQMSRCVGRVETAEVRYWSSGSAPTTTVGIPVEPLEIVTIDDYDAMVKFRAIRTTSTSATLSIECWR